MCVCENRKVTMREEEEILRQGDNGIHVDAKEGFWETSKGTNKRKQEQGQRVVKRYVYKSVMACVHENPSLCMLTEKH